MRKIEHPLHKDLLFEPKKFLISILLGVLGFVGSFYSLNFSNPPFSISITWSYFLPLLAGFVYGWRYGFVAGTLGLGALFPFFLWPNNGWANFIVSTLIILLYCWYGYFHELRQVKPAFWNHPLFVYLPFGLIYISSMRIFYPIAFSFNPPFWNPQAELFMPIPVLEGIIAKGIIMMYVCIVFDIYLLKIPIVRRVFGLEVTKESRENTRIMIGSFLGSILTWFMFVTFNRIFVDRNFPQNLFQYSNDPHELIALVVCISAGFFFGSVVAHYTETRLRAEDQLGESERRFRLLAENSTDMISRHDAMGIYLYASPACRLLLGYEPEELLGHSAFEYFHPADLARLESSRQMVMDDLVMDTVKYRIRCKDGNYIWFESTSRSVKDQVSGKVMEIQVSSRDITEHKKAEEKLRESEQRFFQLFNNLNSNFMLHEIILDENGKPCDYRFLAINPSAEQTIGLKATDMIGKTARELFPDTEQYWIDKFGEVALSGIPIQYENYSKELDKYFDMRIYSPQGGQFALLGLDVTERRLAEEARRESEAKYRLIADNTADVIWVLDVETNNFKYVSPSVEKLRGYTPEEVMSQPVSEALTPESAKKVEELMALWIPQFLSNPTVPISLTSEVDQPCKDGSIVNTEVTTTYVLNESGKLEIVGVSRDITERKKIEKTLYFLAQRGWIEQGDNFFSALARYLGVTLGIDYVFIDHIRAEDKTAQTVANYWLGEIRPNFEYSLANTPCENVFQGKMCSYSDRIQQHFPNDHSLVEMEAESYSGIPLWDSRGSAIGLIALVHRKPFQNIDLTESLLQIVADHVGYEMERQEAEAALRKERDRAQNYLDTVESLIVALDGDGKVNLINRKGCRILGYDESELIGKSWFETCLPQPAGKEMIYPVFLKMIAGGPYMEEYENAIVTRAGELRHISWHNTLLRDEQGKIIGTLSAGEDITERKKAQDELRLLNEQLELRIAERTAQLEEANKELESFSYSVSHDLRAPLRAIDGFSSMLKSDYGEQLSEGGLVLVERVRSNTHRMGALIDDLLRFSRLSRQPLNYRTVDMTGIVQTALEVLKDEREDHHAEFHVQKLPACQGDASLLTQVWVNLLSNALKYSQKRSNARIEIGSLKGKNGENIYFVKDNGVGFSMRYANKLFGVFQRLHSDDEFSGTGVGLALVHRIVTRHGGRIWAESEPDVGATFYFTLG